MNDIEMMRVALDAARKAVASGDIPVGAAIFNSAGELVATGHNERELHNDPTAHAEIVAIRNASICICNTKYMGNMESSLC